MVIVIGGICFGIIEYLLLNKACDFYKSRIKRLPFNPEYNNKIYEKDRYSYSQRCPISPISQIGDYGTCAKNNNKTNEYPKEKSPILFVHTLNPFRDRVKNIIDWLKSKFNQKGTIP
jgi:hypothetical protein